MNQPDHSLMPIEQRQLVLLEEGKRMLAEARTLEAAKDIRDKAQAVEHYLRQRGDSEQAALDAAELKQRAEKRLGELLAEMPKQGPGEYQRLQAATVAPSLADLGIEKTESHRWQRIAAIPSAVFEQQIAEGRQRGELTTAAMLRVAAQHVRKKPPLQGPVSPLHLSGERWHIEQADCLDFLARQPEGSIDLVFGSPPYEDARLYLENGTDQGIARDTEAWVKWMVEVYRAALRCCRGLVAFVVEGRTADYRWSAAPVLLMADLARAGIVLRKPPLYRRVGIPGSGGPDWLRNDYEFVICATNGGRLPWSDNTALGEPCKYGPGGDPSHRMQDGRRVNQEYAPIDATMEERGNVGPHRARRKTRRAAGKGYTPPEKANPGNIVDCGAVGGGNMGSKLCHENEAPFPESLARFFVLSFCPPGGVVCDPFAGSGTTLAVAVAEGRKAVGCDLRASQVRIVERRLAGVTPPLFT
jgi:hypothetical protein